MTSAAAIFPDAREFLEQFGVSPALVEADGFVYSVDIPAGEDIISLSYDVIGRSVRCRVVRGEATIVNILREGVTLLKIDTQKGSTSLVVNYDVRTAEGCLQIRIYPGLAIDDELLLQ